MFEYSPIILDHFYRPRHVGILNKDDPGVGTGRVGDANSSCIMQLQIRIDAREIIREACFKAYGCVSAIATMSWLCEFIIGKSVNEVKTLSSTLITETLQLKPQKIFCALMAEDVLKLAIEDLMAAFFS